MNEDKLQALQNGNEDGPPCEMKPIGPEQQFVIIGGKRTYDSISTMIKLEKKQHDLTNEDLVHILDVEKHAVDNWLYAGTFPTKRNLIKLCKLFDCYYLFRGYDEGGK